MAEDLLKKEEPKKEYKSPIDLKKTRPEKEEVLERIQDILREYNGEESNIPVGHAYWDLMNRYRLLNRS